MNEQTPGLDEYVGNSPLPVNYRVRNSERTTWRWAMTAEVVTGNTPAQLEASALNSVSALTGVPTAQLRVKPGYVIYPVPGDDVRESHLSSDAKRARTIADGDTLYAVIQAGETVPDET